MTDSLANNAPETKTNATDAIDALDRGMAAELRLCHKEAK
jgi:hypothetical protein